MASTKTYDLTAGASVRFYRDGHHLAGQAIVPNGRFEVRHLEPGKYVARDELGGEVAFAVTANAETSLVQAGVDPLGHDNPLARVNTGAPGQAFSVPTETPNVGVRPGQGREGEPKYPKAPDLTKVHAPRSDDQRVPGAPGSAAVQPGVLGPQDYVTNADGELANSPGELERDRAKAAKRGGLKNDNEQAWVNQPGPGTLSAEEYKEIEQERKRDRFAVAKPASTKKTSDTPVSGPMPPTEGHDETPRDPRRAAEQEAEGPQPADDFPAQGEAAPGTEPQPKGRSSK